MLKFAYLIVAAAVLGSAGAVENRQNVCLKLIEHHCGGSATPQVMESCLNDNVLTCAKPKHCLLPAETGMCRAAFPKFYYNQESSSCEKFIYGGCGGNRNNFDSEKECNAACSGIRYCGGETGATCPKMFECLEEGEGEVGTCVPATPDRNSSPRKHKKPLKPQTKPLRTKPKEKVPLP